MTGRKLKVYSWQGWRLECPAEPNGSRATREAVATTSKKKARELTSSNNPIPLREISETGNEDSVNQAMSEPGVIFWHRLDELLRDRQWRRAE